MRLTYEQAKDVALCDYTVGVSTAIEHLGFLGFNTSFYWRVMNRGNNWEDDEKNLKTRDKLFKKLHIFKIMQKAYNEIWR